MGENAPPAPSPYDPGETPQAVERIQALPMWPRVMEVWLCPVTLCSPKETNCPLSLALVHAPV